MRAAIEIGYRNIDTAQAYGNERSVGEGVRTSGVPREELFVSTKLAAEIKDHDQAAAAIDESIEKLGIGYLDLMLIHAPQPWNDFRGGEYAEGNLAAWRALEKAHQAGKIRSIGVSNFLPADLDNILQNGTTAPHVNQILVHAGNTPTELITYCQNKNILVEAYSPIAHGEILKNPAVATVADRYGVSVPQLCIRYTLQLGTVPLPKTREPRSPAFQRGGRLRHLRRGHGRPAEPGRTGLRRLQRVPRLQRQIAATSLARRFRTGLRQLLGDLPDALGLLGAVQR
ncbi:aldo/keto reductase family protein [Kribbella sp. CA-245084]|uniref:aldo/keto reductase family protein n=1 Tax=Kribbella sp. CA-245084 TaxID=3239940 RepID=UPI003D8DD316